jgi:hypothetical protein
MDKKTQQVPSDTQTREFLQKILEETFRNERDMAVLERLRDK